MKVVQINATCGNGSTGNICVGISKLLNEESIENYIFYSQGESDYKNGFKYVSNFDLKVATLKSRITGRYGFESIKSTKKLISKLHEIDPDVIHLHNVHSHNLALDKFFDGIKDLKSKVIITFHDCWPITGYCTHYDFIGCEKWKTNCSNCPFKKSFSFFKDCSSQNHKNKIELFSKRLNYIACPSEWMRKQVLMSQVANVPSKTIYNGINLDNFYPRTNKYFEQKFIISKPILLFAAYIFDDKKGIEDVIKIANEIDDKYQIVLVGNVKSDKALPSNILHIPCTSNAEELAEIYSSSSVFVNTTKEETFGLTNVEAMACGIPVATYDTGGCVETVDNTCGAVVKKNDYKELLKKAIYLAENKEKYAKPAIAKAKKFSCKQTYKGYVDLYKEIIGGNN